MQTTIESHLSLRDVASESSAISLRPLQWVGMEEIAVPVLLRSADGRALATPARVGAFVDLIAPDARGIHMSRLYLALSQTLSEQSLSAASIQALLGEFLRSHRDLSGRAMLRVRFDYLIERKAMVSQNRGWRAYPVTITGVLHGNCFTLELATEAVYSSTCPCSAALSRQMIQAQFGVDFPAASGLDRAQVLAWLGSERGMVATPHSQRSRLQVRARLDQGIEYLPIVSILDRIEDALQTPVQTAVKREDEQAFARANGANLMFCEDAARRAGDALATDPQILDFWARATHEESLHAHDAVAIVTKGVIAGFDGITGWGGG